MNKKKVKIKDVILGMAIIWIPIFALGLTELVYQLLNRFGF